MQNIEFYLQILGICQEFYILWIHLRKMKDILINFLKSLYCTFLGQAPFPNTLTIQENLFPRNILPK